MTGAAQSVLCAGRVYCDLVFTGLPDLPQPGTETFAQELSLHGGGGAFITAAAFSALGWQASLLATLPASPFDGILARDMADLGVDGALCIPGPDAVGPQVTVAMAHAGDRAFLSHKAGVAFPDPPRLDSRWRHLHIGELRSLAEHPDLPARARAAGMSLSLDCGWDADLLARGAEIAALVSKVDVFLPNRAEFARLRASGLPEEAAPLTVVKCGADGARARGPDGWIAAATTPREVVDATGAGDAFNGGFLVSWLAGDALERSLTQGNRCGGASVGHRGGTGGLTRLRDGRHEKAVRVAQ